MNDNLILQRVGSIVNKYLTKYGYGKEINVPVVFSCFFTPTGNSKSFRCNDYMDIMLPCLNCKKSKDCKCKGDEWITFTKEDRLSLKTEICDTLRSFTLDKAINVSVKMDTKTKKLLVYVSFESLFVEVFRK